MRVLRLFRIFNTIGRFGLYEYLPGRLGLALGLAFGAVYFWRPRSRPRAERLRLALEDLGPIFVKFGQLLSTRRDLLPADIADELAKLQDHVPPFPSEQVVRDARGAPTAGRSSEVFAAFDATPVASASVAQVHFATLPDGARGGGQDPAPGHRAR